MRLSDVYSFLSGCSEIINTAENEDLSDRQKRTLLLEATIARRAALYQINELKRKLAEVQARLAQYDDQASVSTLDESLDGHANATSNNTNIDSENEFVDNDEYINNNNLDSEVEISNNNNEHQDHIYNNNNNNNY